MSRATTRGIDVLPERLLDPLLAPELLGHPVEGLCELADLVLRRHRHGDLEIAGLDGLRSVHHPPQRAHQPLRSHRAQPEPDDDGEGEQDDVQPQDARLLGVETFSSRSGQRIQLVAHAGQVGAERLLVLVEAE